jgi:hypothetical protein
VVSGAVSWGEGGVGIQKVHNEIDDEIIELVYFFNYLSLGTLIDAASKERHKVVVIKATPKNQGTNASKNQVHVTQVP